MKSGCDVDSLPAHRDEFFGNWSEDRKTTIPADVRKKLNRLRWKHSKTGNPHALPTRWSGLKVPILRPTKNVTTFGLKSGGDRCEISEGGKNGK
jgi:hypothetical protein